MTNLAYRNFFLVTSLCILSTWILQIDFFQSDLLTVIATIALFVWEGYCIFTAITSRGKELNRIGRILIIFNLIAAILVLILAVSTRGKREWNLSCRDCQGAAMAITIADLSKFAIAFVQALLQIQPISRLSQHATEGGKSEK